MTTKEIAGLSVDELAQIIRKVDGSNSLGAGALAEAILASLPPARVEEGPVWQPIDANTKTPALVCRFTDEEHDWLPLTAYRISGGKWERPASRDGLPYEPTHWQPLPAPPARIRSALE